MSFFHDSTHVGVILYDGYIYIYPSIRHISGALMSGYGAATKLRCDDIYAIGQTCMNELHRMREMPPFSPISIESQAQYTPMMSNQILVDMMELKSIKNFEHKIEITADIFCYFNKKTLEIIPSKKLRKTKWMFEGLDGEEILPIDADYETIGRTIITVLGRSKGYE
jgi:hypothetical protein